MNLIKKAKKLSVTAGAGTAVFLTNTLPAFGMAECPEDITTAGGIQAGADCAKPAGAAESLFGGENGIFNRITTALLFLVGAISVIMLIIGGIRYVVSAGDQNAVTGAKNTILYAIVGIIVSFLAFAAVQFVTTQIGGGTEA